MTQQCHSGVGLSQPQMSAYAHHKHELESLEQQ